MLTLPSNLVSVVDVSIMRMGGHQLQVECFALVAESVVAALVVVVRAVAVVRMPAVVVVLGR